jgi:7,8-dihydroneopterin aldolase/epimerase/oxygenase
MDEHERERQEDGLTEEQAGEEVAERRSEDPRERADEEHADGVGAVEGLDPEQEHDREFDEDEDEDEEDALESVTIEISGLSIYTHHGVSTAEREVGQRLVIDLRLELGESDATATDRIEDTVDYAEVCQLVTLVAQQRSHRTLERLCSSIADRLLVDYELEGVWVKAAKPEPPIPLPVDEVAVEVWREPAE